MTMNATQRSSVAYRLARRVLDMLVRRNVALVLVLLALVLGSRHSWCCRVASRWPITRSFRRWSSS